MAVVYQYQCKDSSITDSYIGSTCNLPQRKRTHKCHSFKSDIATPFHKFVLEHGGWENWNCIILAQVEEGIEKQERFRLEQAFIRQLNPTLNTFSAYLTEDEAKKKDAERSAQYRILKPEISKGWFENNQEHLKEYAKQYRKRRFECSCGKSVTLNVKARHLKTKFHIENSVADQ